jgi:asparagine synthase (glutamine-hydrolysing)
MCGIVGISGSANLADLKLMLNAIHHRGPDDEGIFVNTQISLGMRRLAIVDIFSGQQPVFNQNKDVCVIFNGEIYNHVELRAKLISDGYIFKSRNSEAEVIANLYDQYGQDCFDQLNGMFSIAIWDGRVQNLILCRDRLGIKPLYYTFIDNEILFASEIKSLLRHPKFEKSVNYHALYHYFSFKHIPSPYSAFKNIFQLEPGHLLIFSNGKTQLKKWWGFNMQEEYLLNEDILSSQLLDLLEDSVSLQMEADVEVGAYLSGGVDSTAVVALMSKHSKCRVKTFSLVYDESFLGKDRDREYARMVAKKFNSEHSEYLLTPNEILNSIDDIVDSFDDPFSGVISTYFITRLISKKVKVALSGDGADELFGSYASHRNANLFANFLLNKDIKINDPLLMKVAKLGDEAEQRLGLHLITDTQKKSLFSDLMQRECSGESSADYIRSIYQNCDSKDPLNRALFYDQKTLLPDQVLTFVDRLSMHHSVEVRPPFLDHRIVEFAARIPPELKIKNSINKYILKKSLKNLVPDEIINRPKEGFVLPTDEWLRGPLKSLLSHTLSAEKLRLHGLFNYNFVNILINQHLSKRHNNGPLLWNLIMFQKWWEKYFLI